MSKAPSTAWYDVFSTFYDTALDATYRPHREAALAALAPEPGMTVVDVGCGTGASFSLLAGAVGEGGLSAQPWAAQLGRVDRVQCFLTMSVIPDWERVLMEWLDALAPGGRLVIADVYNAEPGPYARLVELTARAQISRRSWEPLHARTSSFDLSWQKSSWSLGGQFFIARGDRAQ